MRIGGWVDGWMDRWMDGWVRVDKGGGEERRGGERIRKVLFELEFRE